MIATRWFNCAQIASSLGLSKESAKSYCDRATDRTADGKTIVRVFNGGYGTNILDKFAGQDDEDRRDAARRLASWYAPRGE
jgi:hypothetical protein